EGSGARERAADFAGSLRRTSVRRHAKRSVVYLDEPLIHRAKDDGRFAAPAMWVAVVIIFLVQERVADAQLVQDGAVGVAFAVLFQNGFADQLRRHLLFD